MYKLKLNFQKIARFGSIIFSMLNTSPEFVPLNQKYQSILCQLQPQPEPGNNQILMERWHFTIGNIETVPLTDITRSKYCVSRLESYTQHFVLTFRLLYHDVTFSQATTISWSELERPEVTTFSISHLVKFSWDLGSDQSRGLEHSRSSRVSNSIRV